MHKTHIKKRNPKKKHFTDLPTLSFLDRYRKQTIALLGLIQIHLNLMQWNADLFKSFLKSILLNGYIEGMMVILHHIAGLYYSCFLMIVFKNPSRWQHTPVTTCIGKVELDGLVTTGPCNVSNYCFGVLSKHSNALVGKKHCTYTSILDNGDYGDSW